MSTFDPAIIFTVLVEFFGPWLWLVLLLAAIGITLFVLAWLRDRKLLVGRLQAALVLGILGGFAALAFTWWITHSSIGDVGGAIDAILVVGIWLAGFLGATILSYGVLALGLYRPKGRA
ncbi:DUF5368 family protein [Pelagibacterium montanilacus]|uniref:DUF5368 family protein n=1 Tax=Pelagibacterium montanilacus TaxID=2185280 RepID=UPI000F8D6040|nr:DUF5368 family protein [Pelagibacterium montanilacus]